MATYYVDATLGNNNNLGDQANPWQTISKINAYLLQPGDTVKFKRGETWSGTAFAPTASGTNANRITFTNYGTGALPVLNGTGLVNNTNIGTDYLTFDGLDFANANSQLFNSTGTRSGLKILNCTFSGTAAVAVKTVNADLLVDGCTFSATVSYGLTSTGANIQTRTVQNCTITTCPTTYFWDHGDTGGAILDNITATGLSAFSNLINSNASSASGAVTVTNCHIECSGATGNYVISVTGGAHTVTISNNIITLTNTSQTRAPINILNQPNAIVSGNTIDTRTTGALSHIKVAATSSINCGTVQVKNNTCYSRGMTGYIFEFGTETPTAGSDNMLDGLVCTHNILYGGRYYDRVTTSSTHGIFFGHSKCGIFAYNYVNGAGYAYVIKSSGMDWNHIGGVYYNELVDNGPVASVYLKGSVNVAVYNNTFWASPFYSVFTTGHVYISNNTVGYSTGAWVKNNIFVNADPGKAMYVDAGSTTGLVSDYNIFYSDTGVIRNYYNGTLYSTFADWKVASGQDSHSVVANPLLDNPPTTFALQSGSPAINAGVDVGLTVDIAGNAVAGIPDIGAHELVDNTPDQFVFTPQTNVDTSTTITSNTVTIAGVNTACTVTVANGLYSINGGAFTASPGTAHNGDTLTVQIYSPYSNNTAKTATLTVGNTSAGFTVVTMSAYIAEGSDFALYLDGGWRMLATAPIRATVQDETPTSFLKEGLIWFQPTTTGYGKMWIYHNGAFCQVTSV